ncbi:phytanoyl-CoA dioxygenase family protein [Phycisphaera mikurensis]|uniref:Putative dioxygenase n=1 Tax=Phycisphaera mikurensis (strain NBRC 102666 / KCTC 22515 / FYK2301M01) TaxID=1142394 RepID=I0ICF1_PHYMF|nr:phytanoyl-CoA dioxygenase family protein [Phycisphaera mikurensis]MBB6442184.1 ectoine hydroxylase-related dioxygenase (phytanoyl-CoA dioxygenase family) [Phycisphaera mikurensis]BAM02939.1 putative dioxygenase [Phycisphaera mikurensis NBRC 102666]
MTTATSLAPPAAARLDASRPGFLTPEAAGFYHENGYLIVENALDADDVRRVLDEATAVCRGKRGAFGGQLGDHGGQTDEEVLKQYLCIHFPHKISAFLHGMLSTPAMVETLTGVIGPDVKCMQSMLFIKAAGKPGQAWHQDEDYIPTRDRSLCGGWIALDDATTENGCLWVLPGSHRRGVLYPQAVQEDRRFDCAEESTGFPWSEEDAVPVEVKAGSIVFFNGYLLHRSLPNTATAGFRRVLVNHYMSATSLLPWTANLQEHDTFLDHNRTVAKADARDVVMIAGEDPYAWMGTRDVNRPHVRPSGEGGCAKEQKPGRAVGDG